MAIYMVQASYTPQAWAALAKAPEDRGEALKKLMESLGGKFIDIYYTMGDYDVVARLEAPDDVTAMAGVAAAVSAGHLKATKTTRLLTTAEAKKAMGKAGGVVYPAPKG